MVLWGAHYKRLPGFAQPPRDEKFDKVWRVTEAMWQQVERGISDALGERFRLGEAVPLGGGCINQAYRLTGGGQRFFVKLNTAERLPMFEAEAAGLAAIRGSASVRAPAPIAWGTCGDNSWLALEYLDFAGKSRGAAGALGERLAAMHRTTADAFGWQRDNTIGSTPQRNPWTPQWLIFYREQRLRCQLELARDNGLPGTTLTRADDLLDALPGLFAGYSPPPALLHGDLWGGNWGVTASGGPVIFDPAVYFGDRETDLAMTELFGGFDQAFYQAYRAAWPLDPGYETRRQLYNLYHVLNHFNLFGGGYAGQARELVEGLLAALR